MKIGICQFAPVFGEIEKNLTLIERMISSESGVDLWILPELCTTGYLFVSADEASSLAEEFPAGRTARCIVELSADLNTSIVLGVAEKLGTKTYNSAVVFTNGNFVGTYRKIHLFFDEKRWFSPGFEAPKIFQIGDVKIGVMICFDWIFPETARSLALGGAQIIAHPANLVLPFCQDAMVTRSLENGIFTATVNRIGTETRPTKTLTFTGKSQIVDPLGKRLEILPSDSPKVAVIEIDPGKALDKNFNPMNHLFNDRKPELYRL
ncbi:MAG: acyltransferase [Candidatus Marinimicrobia bacterium]|nr:acyltransferase [Candidatus Neomarinimicrobiota bacterium]